MGSFNAVVEFMVDKEVYSNVVNILSQKGRHVSDVTRRVLEVIVSRGTSNFIFEDRVDVVMVYPRGTELSLVKVLLDKQLKNEAKEVLRYDGREMAVVLRTVFMLIISRKSAEFLWNEQV